ncbi:FAD-binding domain-containing protein [Streptomyces sp. NPDC056683]|uniref:FAD-binding domain-containing protein n=1 Tax=Streptomyces sp. NPDC056683 TaxID=3345910 RepID=UPI003690C3F6
MNVSAVLFTADLRLHDHPPLRAALDGSDEVAEAWRAGRTGYPVVDFLELLVDGDVANNRLNWQWVAGTDTRPNRVLNPVTRARRYDPDGAYVRRRVPELAGLPGAKALEPWKVGGPDRAALGHPEPIVDLADGLARFRQARERR